MHGWNTGLLDITNFFTSISTLPKKKKAVRTETHGEHNRTI